MSSSRLKRVVAGVALGVLGGTVLGISSASASPRAAITCRAVEQQSAQLCEGPEDL